ncbi:tetratricopeptide repeat protein, partial [Singulisphaera rosea]
MSAFDRRYLAWLAPLILLGSAVGTWAFVIRKPVDPDQIWRKAEEDFRAGAYDRAEQAVTTLARLRTPTAHDWMLRSQIAMQRGQADEAIVDLAKIPDQDPLGGQARLMAGQLDLRRHRTRPAEQAFFEALKIDPKLVQARRELIYLYGVQVRRKALGEQFLKLSETVPLTFDNVFHWCLTRNTVWEPLELTQIMGKFVDADPGDRWSRLTLAEAQRQLGHKDQAEATLKPLEACDPDARAIRVRLAFDRGDEAG